MHVSGSIERIDAENRVIVLRGGETLRVTRELIECMYEDLEITALCEAGGTWPRQAVAISLSSPCIARLRPPGPARRRLAVVQRGRAGAYEGLKHHVSQEDMVHVIWDRRGGDRRRTAASAPTERRRGERRSTPPATWMSGGFLLVSEE
jgi:hypothetical protein